MKKNKRPILIAIALLEIFFLNAGSVLGFSIPSASSVASDLENRYHLNLESMQNESEYFNTADNKKPSPQVMLSFSPSNPTLGEKITANAFPMYFNNTKESLYYTWYLKHPDCKKASNGSPDYNSKCDLNSDERVNEEDWKIEAMRIIANDGVDSGTFNYEASSDSDSYSANFGGNDAEGMSNHCYIHDFTSGINYEIVENASSAGLSCPSGTTARCIESESTVSPNVGGSFTSGDQCVDSNESVYCANSTPICSTGTPMCIPTSTESPYDESNSCSSYISNNDLEAPTCTAGSTPNSICKHLFPHAPGYASGDGAFGRGEEEFWKTNPDDPDTADSGNSDEANVVGLGQDTFSWNYEPGDKVGVVIEGMATISTKYNDSSMMIMWALPKNKCSMEETGTMTKTIKGYSVSIPIAEVDINDCLEENLVDPREGGQSSKLDVSLSYTPQNPVNDSSGNSGDKVMVSASVFGAKNQNYLKYVWKIYRSDELNPASWGESLLKSELSELTKTSGMGLNNIKFNLNFPNPPKYLKVSLEVSENISTDIINKGRSSIIIPVSSSSNQIRAYSTSVSDDLKINKGKERCTGGLDKVLCPVAKNEIIRVEVSEENLDDFAWTIDGAPFSAFSYDETTRTCLSGECKEGTGENINVAYFPILKGKGEKYAVTLNATDTETGEKVNLSKTFVVSDPKIEIVSEDENNCRPAYLGSYVDLDGKSWSDFSDDIFESYQGVTVKLKPASTPSMNNFTWYIDGVSAENVAGTYLDLDNTISFNTSKKPGEAHTIKVASVFTQDRNTKRALNDYWGIQLNEFYEKLVVKSIDINILYPEGDSIGQKKSDKFLASLAAGLPSYINFLLRIVLTILLILGTSWIFMSLPQNEAKRRFRNFQ